MSSKPRKPVEIVYRDGYSVLPIRRKPSRGTHDATDVVSKTNKQVEIEKGYQSEKRFKEVVTALTKSGENPWIIDMRKSSEAEDCLGGYDFVVTFSRTYLSKTPYEVVVDVKTSFSGVVKYRDRRGNNGVFLVVAGHEFVSRRDIRNRLRVIWMNTRHHSPHFDMNFKKD